MFRFQRMYAIQDRSVRQRFGNVALQANLLIQFHLDQIDHFDLFANRTDDLLC